MQPDPTSFLAPAQTRTHWLRSHEDVPVLLYSVRQRNAETGEFLLYTVPENSSHAFDWSYCTDVWGKMGHPWGSYSKGKVYDCRNVMKPEPEKVGICWHRGVPWYLTQSLLCRRPMKSTVSSVVRDLGMRRAIFRVLHPVLIGELDNPHWGITNNAGRDRRNLEGSYEIFWSAVWLVRRPPTMPLQE